MNRRIYFILFIILTINNLTDCKAQTNNNIEPMETYNFELMNNTKYNPLGITRNGWRIAMYTMTITGAYYNEYPPVPEFYAIQKRFYPSGKIKSKIMHTGEGLAIGESIYYDEDGKITSRVDEDAKFGKIKIDDLLKFIEEKGHVNLETGWGREDVEILEDGRCNDINSNFAIYEGTTTEGIRYWEIIVRATPDNNYMRYVYHIEKNTGEVLLETMEYKFPIW